MAERRGLKNSVVARGHRCTFQKNPVRRRLLNRVPVVPEVSVCGGHFVVLGGGGGRFLAVSAVLGGGGHSVRLVLPPYFALCG